MSKVIVITGGSDGLGKSLAEDLTIGNKVIILSNDLKQLEVVAQKNHCDYYYCDVAKYIEVEKVINNILAKYKKIDVLINNAGIWIQDELDKNDPDKIKEVINVNLLGIINCAKAVIPSMKKEKSGLIINVNSQAGINTKEERTVYYASKWGVTGFTKSLQLELAKYGIRVTNLMPGVIKTNMYKKMNVARDLDNGLETYDITRLVRFIIETPFHVMLSDIGIKHINYNL